jgi:hypothetical protein
MVLIIKEGGDFHPALFLIITLQKSDDGYRMKRTLPQTPQPTIADMLLKILKLVVLALLAGHPLSAQVPEAVLAVNPNVLPETSYPFWPAYRHLETEELKTIRAQPWSNHEETIEGWDWSLPEKVEPAANSLVGLQRIFGLDKEFIPLELNFKANGVGILWVKWRDIEPKEGVYDFSRVLSRIQQANAVGLDVVLRVLTCSKLRGIGAAAIDRGDAPLWLEDHGVPLLPRKKESHNLNFDPAHPEFHQRYLRLVAELAKAGIPQRVKAAYVGYASHSFGDEGIGPFPEADAGKNDALPLVRERLDAWAQAFVGMEHRVFMGGSSHYGFAKGFGVRRGFVEMYLYNIPNEDLGQQVDAAGYLYVDEQAPVISRHLFNGEVNEEYDSGWATAERGYRFGSTTNSFPYRYFTSTLRALQMRCTYIHTTGYLVPEMLPFLSLQLGRTVEDAPDVWTFLRTSYLKASNYRKSDTRNRVITVAEEQDGIPVKNFERWLYQRDAVGYETRPAIKIEQSIKMWMVQDGRYFDYIARAGKRIGFDIDDRWVARGGNLAIKVTYVDAQAGNLQLMFNQGKAVKTRRLLGDGRLKTATFLLADLQGNSLDHGFDFVIQGDGDTNKVVISMVRVVATP